MLINFNEQLLPALPEGLSIAQRAVYFGDALFESMRCHSGRIPLFARHWERLTEGMQMIGLMPPAHWDAGFFRREIAKVAPANARVRLTVWRAPGGLYAPVQNDACFLITAEPMEGMPFEWPREHRTLGVSEQVRLPVDAYSNLKTFNAARYVAAAREAKSRGWDDAILLNSFDRPCEATSSNIFWWEGEQLCTVPLAEGCVAGVMRAAVIEFGRAAGYVVLENSATFAVLEQSGEIFLTNAVRGMLPVRIFAGALPTNLKTKRLFDIIIGRLRHVAH